MTAPSAPFFFSEGGIEMVAYRDCKGRIACMGDPTTGAVESAYKGCKTSTLLAIGESFTIERDVVVTIVTRISASDFMVVSRFNLAA